jgi:hypothetical protein
MSKSSVTRPITRDDLEAKFRQVQGGTQSGADAARGIGKATGALVAVGALGVAYMLGRRRGRRRRTVVEVRRV